MTKEELIETRKKNIEPPKCFKKCDIHGCSMNYLHCNIREMPPMGRCTRCQFWFTNLEKLD